MMIQNCCLMEDLQAMQATTTDSVGIVVEDDKRKPEGKGSKPKGWQALSYSTTYFVEA